MKITEELLNEMRRDEANDLAYGIPYTRVPKRNILFYQSIINASCVTLKPNENILYYHHRIRAFGCHECWEGKILSHMKMFYSPHNRWHQLHHQSAPPTQCWQCGKELLISRKALDCEECKFRRVNFRDMIENKIPIVIKN